VSPLYVRTAPAVAAGSAYDTLILGTSNLVNYWPFAAGSVTDVVSGYVITINGTVTTDTAMHTALGPAMNCASGYMKGTAGFTFSSTMSIEGWVLTPGSTGTDNALFGCWSGSVGSMLICIASANQMKFYTQASNNVVGTLSTNTAYHVVGTYDGTNQRGYINGSLVMGPTAASAPGSTSTVFEVAGYAGHAGPGLTGKYSNIAVYSKALSATEVTDHYNAGIA